MDIHPLYGPSIQDMGWVPAPRYLLRRQRILKILAETTPGHLLEIGCGPATLIYELQAKGFCCTALETSPGALEIARSLNPAVDFHEHPQSTWENRFDYLMAFEVLEHIEDDRDALLQWRSWLKPGGTILISVPAHMNRWSASDDWAGHVRRYEKSTLQNLLDESGFTITYFESYGFPLANVIAPFRARAHKRQLEERIKKNQGNRQVNNAMSGISRSTEHRLYPLLKSLPGTMLMQAAFASQAVFSHLDIGDGYVLTAQRHS